MLVTPSTAKVHGGTARPSGGVRQHPPADAGVDVAAHPTRGRGGGDRGHRVDHPVRVRRRAGHDEHGPVVDRGRHRVGPGPELLVDTDHHRLHAEVVRGLVERGVRRHGQHHPRSLISGCASRAPCTASSTDSVPPEVTVPTVVGGPSSSLRGDPDQLVLHPQQAGEGGRVEPVGAGVRRHRLAADPVGLLEPGVVDVGQRPATGDRHVVGLHRAQPRQDVAHAALRVLPAG